MPQQRRRGLVWWALAGVALLNLVALGLRGTTTDEEEATHAVPTAPIQAKLTDRDPKASPNARAVYRRLVSQENAARAGKPTKTVIGQHVEGQNERYNAQYGDAEGRERVGYYYKKAADLTGKLPGFVEGDLGPGYGDRGWGVGEPRWYTKDHWPTCSGHWPYTDGVNDLLFAVWKGFPRAPDGSYGTGHGQRRCDGSAEHDAPFRNGGKPSGIVGMSFHEPYPGSRTKNYDNTRCVNSPARTDPEWFSRVIDYERDTAEYQALLHDLSYLADQLDYYAAYDVPVLLRPYHEMNAPGCHGFWWSNSEPSQYRELWRIMYNYLVKTRGLHNLILVWAPLAWDEQNATSPWDYYPGGDYVDIAAVDNYGERPGKTHQGKPYSQRWYDGLAPLDKPRMLAESYHVPIAAKARREDRDHDTEAARTGGVNALRHSPWVIWSVWGAALTEKNGVADVQATYSHQDRVITGGSSKSVTSFDWSTLHVHDPHPDR